MLTTAVMLNLFYVQKFLPLRGIFLVLMLHGARRSLHRILERFKSG